MMCAMGTTIEAVSHKQSTSMKKAIPYLIIYASHFSIPTKREVGITDLETLVDVTKKVPVAMDIQKE